MPERATLRRAELRRLASTGKAVALPCAPDAIAARVIEEAGFPALAIGMSSVTCARFALPDIELLGASEYRDSVAPILDATRLPSLIDIGAGFGDVKSVARTVESFERLGASALVLEDMIKPAKMGASPAMLDQKELSRKIVTALDVRQDPQMMIVGRTDAALIEDVDAALSRARHLQRLGVDAILVTGLPDLDSMRRLRDGISVPLITVMVEGGPWITPSRAELAQIGFELLLYPASLLLGMINAYDAALRRIRDDCTTLPEGSLDYTDVAHLLKVDTWIDVEERADKAFPRFDTPGQA